MKIRGKAVALDNRDTITITRGDTVFELNIVALRLGSESRVTELFPDPRVPSDYVYDGAGNVLRDPKTKKPIRELNPQDAHYVKTSNEVNRRQMCWFIWHGIDDEIDWTFTEKFPGEYSDSWEKDQRNAFFDAMFKELADAGFTIGDLKRIMEAITVVSGVGSAEEAREDFS